MSCDGDSAGIDFGLELVGIDLKDDVTVTKLRNTLRNTVLQPGENPFEALGISGLRRGPHVVPNLKYVHYDIPFQIDIEDEVPRACRYHKARCLHGSLCR